MDDAGGNEPAGIALQTEGAGQLSDTVVLHGEVFQTLPHILLGDAGVKAEVGVGEVTLIIVVGSGEVVGLRLSAAADVGSLVVGKVHMEEQRSDEVKELGVHRPSAVLFHQFIADDLRAQCVDEVLEQELVLGILGHFHIAHALISRRSGIGKGRLNGAEPSFLHFAALGAGGVVIVGVQSQSASGFAPGTGNEAGHEPQHTAAPFKCFSDNFFL